MNRITSQRHVRNDFLSQIWFVYANAKNAFSNLTSLKWTTKQCSSPQHRQPRTFLILRRTFSALCLPIEMIFLTQRLVSLTIHAIPFPNSPGPNNRRVTVRSPFCAPSFSPSTSIQTPPNSLPSADTFLRPRCHFELATFTLCTMIRIGQQACLATILENLAIDVCCIRETRIRNSSSVI